LEPAAVPWEPWLEPVLLPPQCRRAQARAEREQQVQRQLWEPQLWDEEFEPWPALQWRAVVLHPFQAEAVLQRAHPSRDQAATSAT